MKKRKVEFKDDTERILANPYLTAKLNQSRKDMEAGKGTKISLQDIWK